MSKWPTSVSSYFEPETIFTSSGDNVRKEYCLAVGKDGRQFLKEIREYDISDYINSFAAGCDMSIILNKLQAGLIPTDFNENHVVDLTIMPKSVVDALTSLKEFKSQFANFDPELQAVFGYDPDVFINSFVNGQLSDVLARFNDTKKSDPPEPDSPEPDPPVLNSD